MKRIVIAVAAVVAAIAVARSIDWRMPTPKPVATVDTRIPAGSPQGSRNAPASNSAPEAPKKVAPPSLSAHQFDVLLTRIEKLDAVTRDVRDAGAKSVEATRVALTELNARLEAIEARLATIETAITASVGPRRKWSTKTVAAANANARATK